MKLEQTLIDLIQDNRAESIRLEQLSPLLLDAAYREKWFKIWVPKEFGGLALPLVDGCKLLEELAYWDGGLSWTVTLCAGATMFVGFMDQDTAGPIFSNSQVCFGGSGQVGGTATKVDGGYRVSGKWAYATGAPHLSHFTANVTISDRDRNMDAQAPPYKSLFIPREQVLIHYDWHTFGLEATAGHSFSVQDIFVPYEHTFDILPEAATHPSPLFQYFFRPFADLTLFVNYLGIFRRFCDLVQKYFHRKSEDAAWNEAYGKIFFKQLDAAQQLVQDSTQEVYVLADNSWDRLVNAQNVPNTEDAAATYEEIAMKTRRYVAEMKMHFMELFPKCGIQAAQSDTEMNSVFRNFFTATQHSLLNIRT